MNKNGIAATMIDETLSLSAKRTSVTDLSSLVNNNNGLNQSPSNPRMIGNSNYKKRTLSIAPSYDAVDHLVTPKMSAKNLYALSPGGMREHPSSRTIDRARGGGGYLDQGNLSSIGGGDL